MKRSVMFNVVAAVAFVVAVLLYFVHETWLALLAALVGAGFAFAAGRAMQHEVQTRPRRHEEEDE